MGGIITWKIFVVGVRFLWYDSVLLTGGLMPIDEERFSFWLPDDTRGILQKYAKENDMNLSQVVRIALREFVASLAFQPGSLQRAEKKEVV